MKYLMGLLMFLSLSAHAGEGWICEEEATQQTGNVIKQCGVGEGKRESEARRAALHNLLVEMNKLCMASTDCKDHYSVATPLRSSCKQEDGEWKCYRLVQFAIGAHF